METDKESLTLRLRLACVGHPTAKITWPHRILHEAADEIADLTARLADAERDKKEFYESVYKRLTDAGISDMEPDPDGGGRFLHPMDMLDVALTEAAELRAEVTRLKEQNSNVSGNYLTLLAEPCIYCGQAEYEKKEAEARLTALQEAVTAIITEMPQRMPTEMMYRLQAALAKSDE